MGVKQHEQHVKQQFLEFHYRYVVEVLRDAQLYSKHASKPSIDCNDVKVAIKSRVNFFFCNPSQLPSHETLMDLAKVHNSIPLPKAISGLSIALPPAQGALIASKYQIVVTMKQAEEMEIDDKDGIKPPPPIDKNGMSSPASQHSLEQDGSKKLMFTNVHLTCGTKYFSHLVCSTN
ncbi:hypothetical protein L7F22_035905 [Adiantum nelumboides]|nr:hypothetical protein [Adiantum nelumboides]